MAPITITVVDGDGNEQRETLSSDYGLERKLIRYGVGCLVNAAGCNVDDFGSLEDRGTYKLGPPRHQPGPPLNIIVDVAEVQNRSIQTVNQWMQEPKALPSVDSLARFVRQELPCPIPSLNYLLVSPDDLPAPDVLKQRSEGGVMVDNFLESIRSSIWGMTREGTSEDTVHPVVEMLVLVPIRYLTKHCNAHLRTDRNAVDASGATLKALRPDVLGWLPSGILAFKGEDKATAAGLAEAADELSSKLASFTDTFFGRIPYQLCYALGGEVIRFFALIRNTNGTHLRVPLTDPTNLSAPIGRSLCVRYAVNIARILVKMHRLYPEESVVSLGKVVKTWGSEVTILGDMVRKKTTLFTGQQLGGLYDLMKESRGVTGLPRIEAYKFARNGSTLTLHLSPVGFCTTRPKSTDEVKVAGRRILAALKYLHDNNWVHRDIRPSNIMLSDGQWFLIDLEWASHTGAPVGSYNPQDEWTPPEITGEGCSWKILSDMWQFGRLLSAWGHLSDSGNRYVHTQLQQMLERRLSADESLQHEFFKL